MNTIKTWQDSLGHWHATVSDEEGNTIAGTPAEGEYGFDTEAEAQATAQRIVNRYEKSYNYNDR